ncbi:MAG: hypothetical protein AVDCRST_MAG51-2340, partial [uncultured Ramlibacter sp.]
GRVGRHAGGIRVLGRDAARGDRRGGAQRLHAQRVPADEPGAVARGVGPAEEAQRHRPAPGRVPEGTPQHRAGIARARCADGEGSDAGASGARPPEPGRLL